MGDFVKGGIGHRDFVMGDFVMGDFVIGGFVIEPPEQCHVEVYQALHGLSSSNLSNTLIFIYEHLNKGLAIHLDI